MARFNYIKLYVQFIYNFILLKLIKSYKKNHKNYVKKKKMDIEQNSLCRDGSIVNTCGLKSFQIYPATILELSTIVLLSSSVIRYSRTLWFCRKFAALQKLSPMISRFN